ncbi:MAG: RsbV: anti-sigma-B factor antagonist [Cyanobacteriota bacterium]|jgi:anti-sigma B factor antagonist
MGPMAMELTIEQHGDGVLVRLSGDIDTLTAPELQTALNGELQTGAQTFVIDMAAVRYISSMGLRVFLSHLKRLKAQNGSMVIASPSKLVSEVFHMSGFSSYFDIIASLDQLNRPLEG